MALVSFRLFCKNLGHLREFFGQMVYRPPLAKNFPYAYGDSDGKAENKQQRQRTVVWLNYYQSEDVTFVNFPCASENVSCQ